MFFCIFKLFWIILLKNLKQQEEDKFTRSAMKKCENLPHYCCLNFMHICHTHMFQGIKQTLTLNKDDLRKDNI